MLDQLSSTTTTTTTTTAGPDTTTTTTTMAPRTRVVAPSPDGPYLTVPY